MITKIKSIFILKKIVNHLTEKSKLLLFANNKNIQHKINIDIYNYILFSKVYKIAEKDGKGEEYKSCNKQLIFTGEYKN